MRAWIAAPLFLAMFGMCRADELADSVNELGIALLKNRTERNAAVCPYSLQYALLMTWIGTAGETRQQMSDKLGFNEGLLSAALEFQESFRTVTSRTGIEWLQAGQLFGQRGTEFKPDFLRQLDEKFDAPLEEVNFKENVAAARETINRWVKSQTHGRIPKVIPDDGLGQLTRLVLVDALYFKASWKETFSPTQTRNRIFRLSGSENIQVPTMHGVINAAYSRTKGLTILGIPYTNPDLQLLILMPDSVDGMADLESRLRPDNLARCASIPKMEVELYIPRFRFHSEPVDVKAAVRELGVTHLFNEPNGSADLSKMSDEPLAIAAIYQSTFVEVNEEGTEAAAATAAEVYSFGEPPAKPPVVFINRPFLFAIQHRPSGMCLFLGRVSDPR